jgi:hypothetical protein
VNISHRSKNIQALLKISKKERQFTVASLQYISLEKRKYRWERREGMGERRKGRLEEREGLWERRLGL